jgi:hypothetical protein
VSSFAQKRLFPYAGLRVLPKNSHTKPQSRTPSPRRGKEAGNKNNILKNNAKDPLPNPPPQAGEGIFSKTWGNLYGFESALVLPSSFHTALFPLTAVSL